MRKPTSQACWKLPDNVLTRLHTVPGSQELVSKSHIYSGGFTSGFFLEPFPEG
jgi:hypothetical protein